MSPSRARNSDSTTSRLLRQPEAQTIGTTLRDNATAQRMRRAPCLGVDSNAPVHGLPTLPFSPSPVLGEGILGVRDSAYPCVRLVIWLGASPSITPSTSPYSLSTAAHMK